MRYVMDVQEQEQERGLDAFSGDELVRAWEIYAGQISYHHADDTGREWRKAQALGGGLFRIEEEMRARGMEMPSRADYLL